IAVKLGEHNVPEFDIAVTVAADAAGRLAAAVLLAAVKIDLRAGTAGAGTVLPEVVLLAHAYNAIGSNADFLCPDLKGLVVVLINGNPQLVNRHLEHLCAELPGPGRGLVLEVIAEGEIAEHLKV